MRVALGEFFMVGMLGPTQKGADRNKQGKIHQQSEINFWKEQEQTWSQTTIRVGVSLVHSLVKINRPAATIKLAYDKNGHKLDLKTNISSMNNKKQTNKPHNRDV